MGGVRVRDARDRTRILSPTKPGIAIERCGMVTEGSMIPDQTSPLLTVGIPTYNEEYAVVTAIASVLNQTWNGTKEILVVDDGSKDGTREILQRIAATEPSLRVVFHTENRGRPAARSTLLKEARGRYFAMLDADDEWYPDKLQRQFAKLAELEQQGADDLDRVMIGGNLFHVDMESGGHRVKDFAKAYGEQGYGIARVLKGDNTPISQVAMLPTAFMREIGDFDERLARAQDWDFLIRFFAKGGRIVFVPGKPLARFHFTRRGRSADTVAHCMDLVISKHTDLYVLSGVDQEAVRRSIAGYVNSFAT